MKTTIKAIQKKVGVTADGVMGPVTLAAVSKALGIDGDTATAAASGWPTQAEVRSGKSVFGAPGNENALVNITPPYTLYYEGKACKTIRVHQAIAAHVQQALAEVLAAYGPERIHALGLDVWGGCYNYRKTTGASSLSMHAWGVALDFDPDNNPMSAKAPKARFSGSEYDAWWSIWLDKHGAVSMGKTYDKDWMHIQFARFS